MKENSWYTNELSLSITPIRQKKNVDILQFMQDHNNFNSLSQPWELR